MFKPRHPYPPYLLVKDRGIQQDKYRYLNPKSEIFQYFTIGNYR